MSQCIEYHHVMTQVLSVDAETHVVTIEIRTGFNWYTYSFVATDVIPADAQARLRKIRVIDNRLSDVEVLNQWRPLVLADAT